MKRSEVAIEMGVTELAFAHWQSLGLPIPNDPMVMTLMWSFPG